MTIFKSPHLFILNLRNPCIKSCSKSKHISSDDEKCSICFDSYQRMFNLYNKSNNLIYIKDIPNKKNKIILRRYYTFRNFLRHYINNNPKTRLDCKHKFHLECIAKWYTQNDSCPLCRGEILLSNKLDIMGNYLRYKDQFQYTDDEFLR